MRLAIELGVSPRRLWGWEPAETVTRTPGGWRVEREPEFSQEDVDLMLAAKALKSEQTARGFSWQDEVSEFADPDHPEGTHYFLCDGPLRNHAVAAQERAMKAWREESPDADNAGLIWPVEKIDRV